MKVKDLVLALAAFATPMADAQSPTEWIAKALRAASDVLTRSAASTTTAPSTTATSSGAASPTVLSEVEKIFNWTNCKLPSAVKDLARQKGQSTFLPDELRYELASQSLTDVRANKVAGTSVRGVLYSLTLLDEKNPTAAGKLLRVVSAQNYATVDPFPLVDPNQDSVVFTMDCSGYLNAALASGANVPAADLQSAAQAAMQSSQTILVARASVFSPIAIAINPGLAPPEIRLDPASRIDVLYATANALAAQVNAISDDHVVASWTQQDILWTSNTGSSSLQGKGSLSATAGGGIGFVTMKADTTAGGTIDRAVSFKSFDTYILNPSTLPPASETYGTLRSQLTTLVSLAHSYAYSELTDSSGHHFDYLFASLPSSVCTLPWQVDSASGGSAPGSVSTVWDRTRAACVVSYYPTPGVPVPAGGVIGLSAPSSLPSSTSHVFRFSLLLPHT
jgi:hypothetical protein